MLSYQTKMMTRENITRLYVCIATLHTLASWRRHLFQSIALLNNIITELLPLASNSSTGRIKINGSDLWYSTGANEECYFNGQPLCSLSSSLAFEFIAS